MAGHLAALDLGTTSVRAMLFEPGGSVVAHASRPLASSFPADGWVEQSPDDMWNASRAVLEALRGHGEIEALGGGELAGLRGDRIALSFWMKRSALRLLDLYQELVLLRFSGCLAEEVAKATA